jgi:hypothetical protein
MPLRYETAIRDRITAQVAGLRGVYGAPTPGALLHQVPPCVYVMFAGLDVTETRRPSMDAVRCAVAWRVVLCLQHVGDLPDGEAARTAGQALLSDLHAALQGWSPEPGAATPCALEGAPAMEFDDAGRLYFGLDFVTAYLL